MAVAITSYTEIRTILPDGKDTLVIRSICNDYRMASINGHPPNSENKQTNQSDLEKQETSAKCGKLRAP